jgi:hypothetical protein
MMFAPLNPAAASSTMSDNPAHKAPHRPGIEFVISNSVHCQHGGVDLSRRFRQERHADERCLGSDPNKLLIQWLLRRFARRGTRRDGLSGV